jgi:hypothetical protein
MKRRVHIDMWTVFGSGAITSRPNQTWLAFEEGSKVAVGTGYVNTSEEVVQKSDPEQGTNMMEAV